MYNLLIKNSCFAVLLFILSTVAIFAQQRFNFEHISIPDGLSNAQVWDIKQDKYGFLWIATGDGLNRYDGYNFKIYKNDPGDKNSLPNNTVYSLTIDHDGTLWAGTASGVSKYDRANESFENFLPDSNRTNSSANLIVNIVQDSKNRIWLLSSDGIFRINKKTNKITKTFIKDGNNKIVTTGLTAGLLETSSGEIYSDMSYFGIVKYNESTGLFELINVDPKNPGVLKQQVVINLYEDKTGKIWISSQNGFYNYDPHTGSFNEIKLFKKDPNPSFFANTVADVYQDDKGFLWIASVTNGIYRYNMKTNEIIPLDQSEFPGSIRNSTGYWKIYKDDFGILWFTTQNNGLLKLDFQKEPFRLYANIGNDVNSNKTQNIFSIYKSSDDNNLVWLGTDMGLAKYNLKEKSSYRYQHIDGKPNTIPGNNVQSIQRGSSQDLWLGTNKGLSMINMQNNSFTNYDLSDNTKHYKVDYNDIYSLSMDDYGNLWTASNNAGIVKFDTRNKTKQFVPTLDFRTYDLKLYNFIDSINNTDNALAKITKVGDYQDLKKEFSLQKPTDVMIVSVGEGLLGNGMVDFGWLQDTKSDTIWAQNDYLKSFYLSGTFKNRIDVGIIKLKKGSYVLRYRSDDSHSYGKWNSAPPIDSTLWGIQVFDLSGSDASYYMDLISASENKPFINSGLIRKVEYQNDGTVLIGATPGLSKYDIRKNSVEYLQNDPKIFLNQNLKQINDIFVDKDRVAWIATNGGLIKYDQQTNSFKILYDKDGLPSNYIMAIEEDSYGNLWLSTLNGISKFNKDIQHPIFINYDVKDGLQGYAFNSRASFRSEAGDLFFAGQNGFNTFHSSNINKQLPKINITQLKISNELVTPSTENSPLTKSILDTKNIVLAYGQNNISFEFSAIHFSRPEKNQYAYMLEGFDKKGWIYDNRRFATYTNLPPGDYVFRVKGSNGDGVWNEAGTSINIKVMSPWWRTIWAYIGYAICFGLVVFGIDRIQRRRLLSKEKIAAQIREAELRAQIAEKESERKSYELEEARNLQLSMLPTEIPQLPNLSIAVYMKTATEVGGDYYDFHLHMDGTLTVILGDATGHGMMSGMMVSIMKSLFMSDRTNKALKPFFENASAAIKDMRLGRLMMALTCVQIQNNRIITTNAGMPPLIIYRKNSQTIEEVGLNNMPLGAMKGIEYDIKELKIEQGDTLLLMSDGFAELQNGKNEMYGYKRARNTFEETARKEPEEIVNYLKEEGMRWTNDEEPDDDVTFVVIKVK
jgi:serine phosphatase RsbU (regulator of sigma subunit)/ligand-binding sensor domain-containing protein